MHKLGCVTCVFLMAPLMNACSRPSEPAASQHHSSIATTGQNTVGSTESLADVVAAAKAEAIKHQMLPPDPNGYKYVVREVESKSFDFDEDGKLDAAVIVTTCEKDACHPTTVNSRLTILLSRDGRFKRGLVEDVGVNAKIATAGPHSLRIKAFKFGPDDPGCCATEEHDFSYSILPDGGISKSKNVKYTSPAPVNAQTGPHSEPTTKATCIKNEEGCTFETGWEPSRANLLLDGLPASAQGGGAGCVAKDASGRTVLAVSADDGAIQVHGALISLTSISGDTEPTKLTGSGWTVTARAGEQVAGGEEFSAYKADLDIISPSGVRSGVQVRWECGS